MVLFALLEDEISTLDVNDEFLALQFFELVVVVVRLD